MHTQIDTLISDLTAMTSESLSIVNNNFIGLSETQINWKPEKRKWGIAECLDHIAVSFRSYSGEIERVLANPQPATGNLVFRTTLTGGIFIKTMHPDSPVKVPNPSIFNPTQGNLTRGVFEDFLAAHKALTGLIEKSKSLDLSQNKITSPVSSLMKFTLGEALIIMTYHEKRHVLQARRVMELPGFPL